MTRALTAGEVLRVVNRYIGVSGGYLRLPDRFTYASHNDFYAEYCDVTVELSQFSATTRETFIQALLSLPAGGQARVCAVSSRGSHPTRPGPPSRPAVHGDALAFIQRLESGPLVTGHSPQITSTVVARAAQDAESDCHIRANERRRPRAHRLARLPHRGLRPSPDRLRRA